ncbi:MAG TPA: prepilin-type N-terminal cleavage/methylation domain-containing protein [Rhizomicrobium sp.]|jgi:general secretion pathway protein J
MTKGFTLLELLVTITLLSLLSLLLFGGLRLGTRAWDGAQAYGAGTDEVRVVQALLRRELEAAYPSVTASDPLHPVVEFDGNVHQMTFLAPPPQALHENGRERITLSAGPGSLTIHATPELASNRQGDWSTVILRNVASVHFSYFGDGAWRGSWTNAQALPSLVRVQVKFADNRAWPDLIVAPHIEEDASCIFDPVTKKCRSGT